MNTQSDTLAAVDLGSNSFHLVVARYHDGQLQIVDRVKEMVRLGGGLDRQDQLVPAVMDRAVATLERFGQRLEGIPPQSIRAVGTKTLRTARNAQQFIERATTALQHEIEIISGFEEARLIYQGVTHAIETEEQRLLVMDIGGRSTELIRGSGHTPKHMDSLTMGSVSMSQRHFGDGRITPRRFSQAELRAQSELQGIRKRYHRKQWQRALGSSGNIRSIARIIHEAGWARNGINYEALMKLKQQTLQQKRVDSLRFEGLKEERRPVFPGGLAILCAAFDSLGIEEMVVSDGALREGVIYDFVGRICNHDIRELAVDNLMSRYHVQDKHAERIHVMASALFSQTVRHFASDEVRFENALRWGAKLHEIGLAISHRKYHRHSAYLIKHSDIPGFSRQEQRTLGALVGAQRMKIQPDHFADFHYSDTLLRLAIILRLAILLHRGRGSTPIPVPSLIFSKRRVTLRFDRGWLREQALTRHDLEEEQKLLARVGVELKIKHQ